MSDDHIMLTLWAAKEQPIFQFDKNVGLHHVAFHIESEDNLNNLHERLANSGVKIEFSPELLGAGTSETYLADQNTQFIQRIETNRMRVLWLSAATSVMVIAGVLGLFIALRYYGA